MENVFWAEKFIAAPIWGSIASVVTIVGIFFAAVYWWVLQRQDIRQRRWAQYERMFKLAWSLGDEGESIPAGLQVSGIYQLVEFDEFAFATVTALEYALLHSQELSKESTPRGQAAKIWFDTMSPHIKRVTALIKKTKAFKHQNRVYRV